ncbi:AlpA family phage regulatory protein [Nitratireductor sp. GZWM139]|uniref:helix-turn-helix transcriptional regulator n=1 Tax=Nitratireductor sp. GZWM139 TaxID=2950541 RepID=UPI0024BE7992|nr:AlpA family phage regulatory protein [Nitratireductor sp. GZWM139]MDJ1464947.1 AlpA family phage regulatory protein [Nitratireductor sp. GZWM139]
MQHIAELVDEATACKIIGGENTPIHRSTLWRGINAGRFPKPLKIGPGTNRWRTCELIAFLEKAAAERDEVAA